MIRGCRFTLPFIAMLMVIFPSATLHSQETVKKNEKANVLMVTKEPEYPGGIEAMMAFVSKNINYPSEARERKISGKVMVTFQIDENGAVADPKVTEGIGGGCDEEAIRVIKKMPKWSPGESDGKPVRVEMKVPVMFMPSKENVRKTKRASDLD